MTVLCSLPPWTKSSFLCSNGASTKVDIGVDGLAKFNSFSKKDAVVSGYFKSSRDSKGVSKIEDTCLFLLLVLISSSLCSVPRQLLMERPRMFKIFSTLFAASQLARQYASNVYFHKIF